MYVYYASRFGNINILRKGSQISFWPHIVHNLNLYHKDKKEKWTSQDLSKDYLLTPTIEFEKDRTPEGIPYLYRGTIRHPEINYNDRFPYLFNNKFPIHVDRVSKREHEILISLSISIYQNFCLINPMSQKK